MAMESRLDADDNSAAKDRGTDLVRDGTPFFTLLLNLIVKGMHHIEWLMLQQTVPGKDASCKGHTRYTPRLPGRLYFFRGTRMMHPTIPKSWILCLILAGRGTRPVAVVCPVA
ncbi:hypothetical protein TWF569_001027 [Orbilia oligospora]|uniref:Uncharacterized protein n=1 Tax=Orbilia oligospora TaxID=2813651 RepID=A0A7C8NAF4_ORBOL|nr:hypothetical protein TWF102_010907 [Orbilia oligospora]KAF3093103.1 hypothetical protein TWF103_011063 [Orbilia oligospora]KAF3102224.1 hypothetical protein TWF706_005369 [Orbilia oligospora]KAF3125255.1 hypothetical protein TWF569_001027 [Orbilia oligospora]KAF3135876.1 hypothetical protein TWF594_008079 [Orbilia oligospora]